MPVMCPTVYDAAALHEGVPYRLQENVAGGSLTDIVSHVDQDVTLPLSVECIAVNAGVRAGRQFSRNPPLRETDAVIARRRHFVLVGERKRVHGVGAVLHGHIPEGRREQEVAKVGATGSGKVRMGKAQDGIVAVMVTGTAVPARVPGVGTQLDHARRHGRSGIGMPMETRADEGIHGLHGRLLSGTGKHRQ